MTMNDFEPELGQLLFSNGSEGQHSMQPHVEDGLTMLGQIIYEMVGGPDDDWTPAGPCSNSGPDFDQDNDVFAIRAYCWCDGERKGHQAGCPPNFHHKKSGFKCYWYKHVARGNSQNTEINALHWHDIYVECVDELRRNGVRSSV